MENSTFSINFPEFSINLLISQKSKFHNRIPIENNAISPLEGTGLITKHRLSFHSPKLKPVSEG